MKDFYIIQEHPNIVELRDADEVFGEVEEITSRQEGADRANVARVTLVAQDFLHHHLKNQETYICEKGEGRLFLQSNISEAQIIDFNPDTKVIINPGTIHGASPKTLCTELVFLCVSSPAFEPDDVYNDPRGRDW